MGGFHLPAVSQTVIQAAFSYNPTFGCAAGNSIAFAVAVATESQYMVGRILCVFAQQAGFSTDCLPDDVGGAAI